YQRILGVTLRSAGGFFEPSSENPKYTRCAGVGFLHAGRFKAFAISDTVAFSASLTCTPPKPIQPPSGAASATRWPISRIHVFTAIASCGAFASRSREACWSVSMDLALISFDLAP